MTEQEFLDQFTMPLKYFRTILEGVEGVENCDIKTGWFVLVRRFSVRGKTSRQPRISSVQNVITTKEQLDKTVYDYLSKIQNLTSIKGLQIEGRIQSDPIKCVACNGRGGDVIAMVDEVVPSKKKKCPRCHGVGSTQAENKTVVCECKVAPDSVATYEICPTCGGLGIYLQDYCITCQGTGLVCATCHGSGKKEVASPRETCTLCKGSGALYRDEKFVFKNTFVNCKLCHGLGKQYSETIEKLTLDSVPLREASFYADYDGIDIKSNEERILIAEAFNHLKSKRYIFEDHLPGPVFKDVTNPQIEKLNTFLKSCRPAHNQIFERVESVAIPYCYGVLRNYETRSMGSIDFLVTGYEASLKVLRTLL